MPKLTKTIVEALEPAVNRSGTVHWDSQLAGFGVRVFPSGAKKFVLKYRKP